MLYLMRHGKDDETKIGGWSDVELTHGGMMQSCCAGMHLNSLSLGLKQIISSDIKRCQMTAKIISDHLPLPISYDSRLREQSKGLLNGMDLMDAKKSYPQYMEHVNPSTCYPEGESLMDLYERVKQLMPWILKQDKTLLITHRGVINMIYFILESKLPDMDKEQFHVTHVSVHELDPITLKIKAGTYGKSH